MNSLGWSVQPQAGCRAPRGCRKTSQGLLWGLIKVASGLGKILMETRVQEGKDMQSSGVWYGQRQGRLKNGECRGREWSSVEPR